ncbi:GroES-like protein [Trametopsis cervina]|nr:GroES-like protein [Trametopsis cervina]
MSLPIPTSQLGLLSSKTEHIFQTFPVPQPGPNEVLIQNVAVASNPKDWKMIHWFEGYTAVEGSNVAGYVVRAGEGVTEFKGGERVAAFTRMMTKDPKYGAYIQYSVAPASTTFQIPDSTSFEEAATLPLSLMTAVIGLFTKLPIPETPSDDKRGIIIYGASTSVGAYAVQLAKRVGLFVIAVAGASKEYPAALGADAVIDYRDQSTDALEQAIVSAAAGYNVDVAYDAISVKGSTLLLARALTKTSSSGTGKVTYVSPLDEEDTKALPNGVAVERAGVNTAYGEDEQFAARWYRKVAGWLAPSESNPTPFLPNRVRLLPDGLASVPEGLELLRTKQVHAEKLVYRIADTPQLKA